MGDTRITANEQAWTLSHTHCWNRSTKGCIFGNPISVIFACGKAARSDRKAGTMQRKSPNLASERTTNIPEIATAPFEIRVSRTPILFRGTVASFLLALTINCWCL